MNLAEQTRLQISIAEAVDKVQRGLRNGAKQVAVPSNNSVKSYLKGEGFIISDDGEFREGEFYVSLPNTNNMYGNR